MLNSDSFYRFDLVVKNHGKYICHNLIINPICQISVSVRGHAHGLCPRKRHRKYPSVLHVQIVFILFIIIIK